MAWIVRIWTLMFWVPPIASAAAGWFALGRGTLARPVPLVLWFLTALASRLAASQRHMREEGQNLKQLLEAQHAA